MLYQVEAITSTVVVSSSSTTPHVPPDTTAATLSAYIESVHGSGNVSANGESTLQWRYLPRPE